MKNLGIFSIVLLLIFSSCRKDVNIVDVTNTTQQPELLEGWVPAYNEVSGTVNGYVTDDNYKPVADATVKLNGITMTTGISGTFSFENVTMNSKGTYLTVEKAGYFKGSRRFFPIDNAVSNVKIQMMDKVFDQEFQSTTGGTVTIEGASVIFEANSIKKENGESYEGAVLVASKYLDPSVSETLNRMPGNLQGVNTENVEVVLATYGMVAVELQSPNGIPLNIADNKTAEVRMPISSAQLNNAPTEIPLWSFHETAGVWAEESVATKQGDFYVGEVSHFSFWNCDAPFPLIEFDAQIVDNSGNPLDNFWVMIEIAGSGSYSGFLSGARTNANGEVAGKIPANEPLIFRVLNLCGDAIYEEPIGPYSADASLGTLTLSSTGLETTTFTGTLVDCAGNPLTGGIVHVYGADGSFSYQTTSSTFTFDRPTCQGSSYNVYAIDPAEQVVSNTYTVTNGIVNDLGTVSVCGNPITNYVSFTIDGVTKLFMDVQLSTSPNGTFFNYSSLNNQDHLYMGFYGTTVGNYDSNQNYMESMACEANGWSYSSFSQTTQGFESFEVTDFGTNIIGNFSGTVYDWNTGDSTTVVGDFNVMQ